MLTKTLLTALSLGNALAYTVRLEGDSADPVEPSHAWKPRVNSRLNPPVGATNGMSVPEGLCDVVESVSGVCFYGFRKL